MTSDEAIVFDVRGQFAYFRVPSTNRMILTYPFPPRTAVVGLIAGVLGMDRNTYWSDPGGIAGTDVAIVITKPGIPMFLRVNNEQTKPVFSGIKLADVTLFKTSRTWDVGKDGPRGFVTLQKMQVLRDVSYRVFCKFPDATLGQRFYDALENHEYGYPPYLGNVNFFAELDLIEKVPLRVCKDREPLVSSVIHHDLVDPDSEAMRFGTYSTCFDVPRHCVLDTTLPDEVVTGVLGKPALIESVTLGNYFHAPASQPVQVGLRAGVSAYTVELPGGPFTILFA